MMRYVLGGLSGALYFLGWAGFDLWPLSFVAFMPLLWALEPDSVEPKGLARPIGIGFSAGLVMNVGGFYWIASTLKVFSGFSYLWCILISAIFWAFQGLSLSLFAVLYRKLRDSSAPSFVAGPVSICITEWVFPELFPHYFGGSLHDMPLAIQVVDLGGPLLVSALLVSANVGLYELLRKAVTGAAHLRAAATAAVLWVLTLGYGAYRIQEVDARAAKAQKIHVGLVQANMGLAEKRKNPREGLRRHVEQSVELQKQGVDLLIWPETAFSWWLPSSVKNVRDIVLSGVIHTPTLFGGLARQRETDRLHLFNSAFMTDADGNITGSYDKTFLLAFGEYIPFGEMFPKLYEISRKTGRFTKGSHVRSLPLGPYRLSVLICYEDILPGFVISAVREGAPHLLVNITNDAWFGDTHQPSQHLALAKFRAIEHHRALVRATNSGVTTAIDPVGRTIVQGGVFKRESLRAQVPMMQGEYPYLTLGNFPGYLSALTLVFYALRSRRRKAR